jgi:hypothetical protein
MLTRETNCANLQDPVEKPHISFFAKDLFKLEQSQLESRLFPFHKLPLWMWV